MQQMPSRAELRQGSARPLRLSGCVLSIAAAPPGCSDNFLRGDERYEKHATSRLLPGSEELCVDGKLVLVCQEDAGDEFPTNVKIVST